MLFTLGNRDRIELDVAQSRNPVWIRLSDGQVRNAYTLKLRNMENHPRRFELTLQGVDGAMWDQTMNRDDAAKALVVDVPADSVARRSIYIAATDEGPEQAPILFNVRAVDEEGGFATGQARFERPGS